MNNFIFNTRGFPKSVERIEKDGDRYFYYCSNGKSISPFDNWEYILDLISEDRFPLLRSDDEYYSRPGNIFFSIVNYIYDNSPYRNYNIAAGATCALFSFILGRNFKSSANNYSSLYYSIVADSGKGKEEPIMIIEDILNEMGVNNGFEHGLATAKRSLFEMLEDHPHKKILNLSEFSSILMSMGSPNNPRNLLIRELNMLWNKASRSYQNDIYVKSSNVQSSGKKIIKPSLTIIADTTPYCFYKSIKQDFIYNGFINRFVCVIDDSSIAPPKLNFNIFKKKSYPASIHNWYSHIENRVRDDVINLEFTKEAKDWLINMSSTADNLWRRHIEQVMRFSLAWALISDPNADVIGIDDVKWSNAIFYPWRESFILEYQKNINGNKLESSHINVLDIIKKRCNQHGKFDLYLIYRLSGQIKSEYRQTIKSLFNANKIGRSINSKGKYEYFII